MIRPTTDHHWTPKEVETITDLYKTGATADEMALAIFGKKDRVLSNKVWNKIRKMRRGGVLHSRPRNRRRMPMYDVAALDALIAAGATRKEMTAALFGEETPGYVLDNRLRKRRRELRESQRTNG
jgi:hypothetical protein